MKRDHERFDDEGGHQGHPERVRHAKRRFFRAAVEYCEALEAHEVWETAPLLAAFRAWEEVRHE